MNAGRLIMIGHKCEASCVRNFVVFVLNPADGLCCAWFIYPVLCWFLRQEKGADPIDLTQLSRLLPVEDGSV